MLSHVSLGTSDATRAAAFYDPVLAILGIRRLRMRDGSIDYGTSMMFFSLEKPSDGNPASVGNGVMVAFEAADKDQVQRLYDIALANGGTDEGAPGDRGGGFYAGYFRDPDGNKLNAFLMGAE